MNVAFDSWIPVVTTSGERKLASLCSVLSEGEEFLDLAVRPHERVSLMRLFLCVAHAALEGPSDYDDWLEVPKRLPESAFKYLRHWKESFELFHETKPWLQMRGITKSDNVNESSTDVKDWTPVSKLNFSFATGNNATLFDHSGMKVNRYISLEDTVLSMLTYQCFSPGGLISQVYWNGIQSGKSSKDAPCVPSSMIHAFLRGKDLPETIHLNLPNYDDLRISYSELDFGKPVWEGMPTCSTDFINVENATTTYLGRLVPVTRLIRIQPSASEMLLGDGLVYPTFTDGFPPEPSATVVTRNNGENEERVLLSYKPEKAVWRELAAVIVKRKSEGLGGPLSLRNIQNADDCDLVVAALARDKATIVDTAESVFHIPSQFRSPEGIAAYETEVKNAESLAGRLGWAVETYRREMDHGWEGRLKSAGASKGKLKAKLHSTATTHYWTAVEKDLSFLMSHIEMIGSDAAIPTRDAWRKMLFTSACDAYRIACGQETPRQIKAFSKGWKKLTGQKEESKTDESKQEVEA